LSRFTICVFVSDSLYQLIPLLLAFDVLGLVSLVPNQEIGWEERLRSDLFCVEWDIKP